MYPVYASRSIAFGCRIELLLEIGHRNWFHKCNGVHIFTRICTDLWRNWKFRETAIYENCRKKMYLLLNTKCIHNTIADQRCFAYEVACLIINETQSVYTKLFKLLSNICWYLMQIKKYIFTPILNIMIDGWCDYNETVLILLLLSPTLMHHYEGPSHTYK